MNYMQRLYMLFNQVIHVNTAALHWLWLHQCVLVTVSWTWDVSPHSWRWSGCVRAWGAWGGCRVYGSSTCTMDSAGHLWPPSAAVCYCCRGTRKQEDGYNTSWLHSGPSFKSKNRTCHSKTYELQCSHANIIQHRNLQWKDTENHRNLPALW